jgi:hypothetical protein
MTAIQAVPVTYRGTRFRSTLEANWAATFDQYGWRWEYEPVALSVGGESYLCDFYLPDQRVFCEVKGPHNERIHKVRALARALEVPLDEWVIATPLVVILRPAGPGETATWEAVTPDQDIVLVDCATCDRRAFMDYAAGWMCRFCYEQKPWSGGGAVHRSGEAEFWRVGQGAA